MNPIVHWPDPYASGGKLWLKGNLHLHTTSSPDSTITPQEAIRLYESMGYAFIAFTDHNVLGNPRAYRSSLILLAGIEVDFRGERHTCIIHPDQDSIVYDPVFSQDELRERNYRKGNLVILNHPDWQIREHYSFQDLLGSNDVTGIEIYNSKIETLEGSPLSTAKWDRLLSSGRRLLGFANQDAHNARECVDCCNVVKAGKREPGEVFHALQSGSFYCSYGVEILDIGRKGHTVSVKARHADLIRFIGYEGRLLKEQRGRQADITFSNEDRYRYIRIECLGRGKDISWSQPFFRD